MVEFKIVLLDWENPGYGGVVVSENLVMPRVFSKRKLI
jgi:hypothetical protein